MKSNKPLGTALIALAVFGVLAVTLAQMIPFAKSHRLSAITLSDRAAGALSVVEVKNSTGSYTITRENGRLHCAELKLLPASYDALESFAQTCTSIQAVSGIKLPEKQSDLGFERPRAVIKTTFLDESSLTLTIGALAKNQDGYYVRLAEDGPVYLLSSKDAAPFFADASSFVDRSLSNGADQPDILPQSITLRSGSDILSVSLTAPADDPTLAPTYAVSDGAVTLPADTDSLHSFFDSLSGLKAAAVVQLFPSSQELQSYGIFDATGAPARELSFVFSGQETRLALGNRSGDYYYVYKEDTSAVFTVSLIDANWDGATLFRLMRRTPLLPDAAAVESIIVETAGGSYEILPDETGLVATVNGTPLSDRTFGQLYTLLFSFEAQYELDDAVQSILPEMIITISYRGAEPSSVPDVVRFIPFGLRRHAIEINGKALWAVRSGYVQQVSEVLRTLQDGVPISSSW